MEACFHHSEKKKKLEAKLELFSQNVKLLTKYFKIEWFLISRKFQDITWKFWLTKKS